MWCGVQIVCARCGSRNDDAFGIALVLQRTLKCALGLPGSRQTRRIHGRRSIELPPRIQVEAYQDAKTANNAWCSLDD